MIDSKRLDLEKLVSDLTIISEARKGDNKYPLCLYDGKISTALFQRYIRDSKEGWLAWGWTKFISDPSRKCSSALGISKNDPNDVVNYIQEEMVNYMIVQNPDCLDYFSNREIEILYDVATHSLKSLADEYSAKQEISIKSQFEDNIRESNVNGYGGIATRLSALGDRIHQFALKNEAYFSCAKSKNNLTVLRRPLPGIPNNIEDDRTIALKMMKLSILKR